MELVWKMVVNDVRALCGIFCFSKMTFYFCIRYKSACNKIFPKSNLQTCYKLLLYSKRNIPDVVIRIWAKEIKWKAEI
jgi:hypothetical protein